MKSKVLVAWLAFILVSISTYTFVMSSIQYPYYSSWDMDLITVQDLYVMNSGYLHDHIVHPGVSMLVPLHYLSKAAYNVGILDGFDLEDLKGSLSPIHLIAQTTDFLRVLSPLVITLLGLTIWYTLWLVSRRLYLIPALLFLLCCLFPISFMQQAKMIRTDLYGAFFATLSLSLYILERRSVSPSGFVFRILCGFFAGAALIAKIQSVLVLSLIPIIALAAPPVRKESDLKKLKLDLFSSALFVIAILAISLLSWLTPIPKTVSHLRTGELSSAWRLLLLPPLLWMGLCLLRERRFFKKYFKWLDSHEIPSYMLGLLLGVTLIPLAGPAGGWELLLVTFRITFMEALAVGLTDQLEMQTVFQKLEPVRFHILSVLTLLVVRLATKKIKVGDWDPFLGRICIGYGLFVLINILGLRFFNRQDLIWFEVGNLFFILIILLDGHFRNKNFHAHMDGRELSLVSFSLLILLLPTLFNSSLIFQKSRFAYNSDIRFFRAVYDGNHLLVQKELDAYYLTQGQIDLRSVAALYSRSYKQVHHAAQSWFLNHNVQVGDIGPMITGFGVSAVKRDCRLTVVHPTLQSAYVLDLETIRKRKESFAASLRFLNTDPITESFFESKDALIYQPRTDYKMFLAFSKVDQAEAFLQLQPEKYKREPNIETHSIKLSGDCNDFADEFQTYRFPYVESGIGSLDLSKFQGPIFAVFTSVVDGDR